MLKDSKKYEDGKKICRRLKERIGVGKISVDFLTVVKNEEEKVSKLCCLLTEQTSGQTFKDQISKLVDLVEKFRWLKSAIDYGQKISTEAYPVHGIETIIKTFDELMRKKYQVCELKCDQFWGTLFHLLSPAKALQPLVESLSFMTVAKKCLKELHDSNRNEDGKEASRTYDFYSLMEFLTTKGIDEFQTQWNLAFDGSLSVETTKTLLGALNNKSQFDKELKLLEEYFTSKFSSTVKTYIEDFVEYPNVLKQVEDLIRKIDELADRSNEMRSILSKFQQNLENSGKLTLALLHQSTEIVSSFSGENLDCVITELARSSELLSFIEDIVEEDIRFLIDAVEEHSDKFVSESSVSDLIDVHGFLAPLIKKCDPLDFLKMLKESCLGHRDIADKIKHCSTNVNSLRGLYTSIANRGEATKGIINNCLKKGEYCVTQKDGKCEAKMTYVLQGSGEDKTCNYSLSDLHDLRSRAHLIVTSRKNAEKNQSSHTNKSSEDIFTNQVNLLTEISTLLSKLCSSGYVKYQKFSKTMKTTQDLQTNRNILQEDLENWEKELENARKNFYFLNFYRSNQICTLYGFFTNSLQVNSDEVLSLIHFVDRTITKKQLEQESQKRLQESDSNGSPNLLLSTIGEALNNIFNNSQCAKRLIPYERESQAYCKQDGRVIPGEIFVASLEPGSSLTANVILALYQSTSNAFPEPYQIVFCSSQTTWEEIYLLLRRCFEHSKYLYCKSLFCIANVELLPNEMQFKLVAAIEKQMKCYQSSADVKKNADYQLALICRGGDHHHIVEQFAQYLHHIAGMSDLALARHLKSGWPHVKIITSTLPGLGKTEHIKHEVQKKRMNVVTFSISGPFEQGKVVHRLKELKLKKHHCLHLDIGEVSDPLSLDTFLLQLIVTGMVSAGNQFYHLPTRHIYIEIANTLKDWLRGSLVVTKYFTRIHLEWQSYENLVVSTEITSNVQVVCQYLNIFDRGDIGSKEVHFSGPKVCEPLQAKRCQELLAKYFSSDVDITFTTLQTFLRILADQLLKFSKSAFFTIANLKFMVGNEQTNVRRNLFQALLKVSKQFASRAITSFHSTDIRNMVERVKGMIQWEDSNHLLIVFHGLNSQAITAIYRNKSLVPLSVEKLLKSQGVRGNEELEDFKTFTQEQLQEKLEKIACTKLIEKNTLFPSYALTPDNILKMILIILRVRVNVPVIIMGETGCGKTSLVRYLANTCGVKLCTFNFHAGRSEEEIIRFIKEKESHARKVKEQIWIFLDEINTCDHLGLISNIMCHHSLLGRPLSKNLVFLAACNPYKERPREHIKTAGLKGKNITDEYSKLVYRVHPLPEAMIDYVWDYGSLSPEDERAYIQRMVRVLPDKYQAMVVDSLVESQKFIRNAEKNPFCVSLRDVHRCICLISWFEKMKEKPQKKNISIKKVKCPEHLQEYHTMSERYNKRPIIKSIVLALAHCYLSRLPTPELREKYRAHTMKTFCSNGCMMITNENTDTFAAIVRMEEEDYLDRMELPLGTARNAALRENVFVMLVCILNRIPIFVVGKPGCSKSLSIQLIRSNLRGRDSRDPWFRQLPQLYVVSYQGSESSTSEGIIKVFEKARKYKIHNKDVLPVVLLDEVGLAENSKYNPLKVLHSLLEPGEGKLPDVAVVGISNWSLDAAKMNRATHLSRPEPTKRDLYDIGDSLHRTEDGDKKQEEELRCLADSYYEHQSRQTYANFHGLRDYYSLIKSLTDCNNFGQINISLQRNFGGLPGEVTNIQKIFLDKLKMKRTISGDQDIIPVLQLIQKNLEDPLARHLMLITNGDSAIGILKQSLEQLGKETITIYGSSFEEDLSEEYNYRILSRIILCMERDCILVLRDLVRIYGSLYDMLNQNYSVVGNRKNCRVALGPYSNPMCQVHDGFRCIVLIDQHEVDYSDPPFLNRFEKQVLRFSDVLTEDQQKVVAELHRWVQGMSTMEGLESQSQFKETGMFIGFHEDTLPSLVLSHAKDSSPEELLKKCKDDLMWIASPDGVLRTQKCNRLKENSQEVQELSDEYFKKPLHQGFAGFMEHVVTNQQKSSFFASDEIGSKTVVMTFSSIHTDIRQCFFDSDASLIRCQVERLNAYKSEKQLAERINEFWHKPEKDLLVLQCKLDLDGAHLLLARSIIEEKRNSYKQYLSEMDTHRSKHVCIVVHVQRGEAADGVPWEFSFLCGWRQVFLDVLEAPLVPLNEILGKSVRDLLTSSIWPIRRITKNDLLWCFTCIKYTRNQRPLDTVLGIAKNLFNSETVSQIIEKLILESIDKKTLREYQDAYFNERWQVKVACDLQSLINSSTLYCAMEKFVSRLVRNPLAKIVYFLEKENVWPPHLAEDPVEILIPELESLWWELMTNNVIFNISEIPEPRGFQSYVISSTSLGPCVLLSQTIIRKVDKSVKKLFLEDNAKLMANEDNLDDNGQLKRTVRKQQLKRFSKMTINLVPELHSFISSDCQDLYMKDIFDMMTAEFSPILNRLQRVSIVEAMFDLEVKQNFPAIDMAEFFTLLHTFVWIHWEMILDLLRMVDCCRPFIGLNVLTNLTNDRVCSSKVMLLNSNGTNFSQEEPSTNEYSGRRSEGSNNTSVQTEEPNTNANERRHDVLNHEDEPKANETEQNATKVDDIDLEFEEASAASADLQDNKEETSKEEIQHREQLDNFEDVLLTTYCEEMFPSEKIIKKNGGVESWARNANILLSLASKISEYPPALHYLRLCVDFYRIVFTSTTSSSLFSLNEIGTTLKPEYLDHEESFETITNQLIKPLEEDLKDHTDKQEALQKFSALFYGRCIDTNVDTSAVRPIVEQVLSLERPELVMMMIPVVLRLLIVEEIQSPGIFMNIVADPSVIENSPCLQNIDKVFKDRYLNRLIHHDSYPAVMICDLIQRLLNFEDHFKIGDIDKGDCKVLMLAKSAKRLIAHSNEDGCGLRVLSAVVFLRGFFTMLAQFVAGNPSVPNVHVITEINSQLKDPKSSSQIFFLKQLYKHASLFDLQKWFGENNILPTIQELLPEGKYQDKAVFTSVFKYPEYEKAKAAYWRKWESNDDSSMQEFLTTCLKSPDHAFALLGLLINMVYLKRALRKLTDKEEQLVEWFAENAVSFGKLFQELLLRIIGRRDFHCPQLQLSPESSVKEAEVAVLVLHIASVVATGALDEKLPIYRYFTNPAKFERPCVLAHCKDVRSVFKHKGCTCVTCACGSRMAFKSNVKEKTCLRCRAVLSDETRSSASPETYATLSKIINGDTSLQWQRCTEQMSPAVYRALHLIVYASYYAGIALGTSSTQELSSVVNILHGCDLGSDSTSQSNFCFQTIENDLSYLIKILSCKEDVAIKSMHLVVEKSSDLIRSKKLLGENDCSTQLMRREWEAKFSQRTEAVFLNVRETSKEVNENIKLQQTKHQDEITLDCRILELDNYPKEPEEQKKQLERLFRVTKQPSLDDFRSAFLYSPKDVQIKHSFLSLFFEKIDQPQVIGNLYHLLKWSRVVSSALTHRISRKDAQSKSINDFITGHLLELKRSPQETETLEVLFKNFQEAWNKMRPLVNKALKDKKKDKMPRLTENDYVAYSLTESDFGIYLETAIKILVSCQNSILDAIISLSCESQHPALRFLENENGSGVMSASIQAVKEKEIISFKWSDDLFQYAQNNLEYGKGQQITYDFEQIEMELATEIAFGKCYLTGTLNKFIFAKELFHSCGLLLTEIRSLVKQMAQSLPEEVCKGLSNLKERRIKDAQDLLQHIEVLIYLLKQKFQDFNVDMTLEELAQEWKPMLPSPFPVNLLPQPRSSIKIKHVAALYEALEDVLADGAIEGLADKFRNELPGGIKDTVRAMVEEIDQLKPHFFLKALRRFVFRYLSSETERYWPKENTALKSCLRKDSLWFPLEPPSLDEIPQDISLKYIYSIVKYLEELLGKVSCD